MDKPRRWPAFLILALAALLLAWTWQIESVNGQARVLRTGGILVSTWLALLLWLRLRVLPASLPGPLDRVPGIGARSDRHRGALPDPRRARRLRSRPRIPLEGPGPASHPSASGTLAGRGRLLCAQCSTPGIAARGRRSQPVTGRPARTPASGSVLPAVPGPAAGCERSRAPPEARLVGGGSTAPVAPAHRRRLVGFRRGLRPGRDPGAAREGRTRHRLRRGFWAPRLEPLRSRTLRHDHRRRGASRYSGDRRRPRVRSRATRGS